MLEKESSGACNLSNYIKSRASGILREEAYRLHESQPQPRRGKPSLYYVTPETDKNSSFVYSLVYSTVGEDVIGGDMFENISAEFLTR